MYRKLASALLVASAINAKYALALGLGGMTMHSALNQPLDAEIALSNVGDLDESQIMITMASPEDFQKAGVDRAFFLSEVKFDVMLDGKGGGVVKLRSNKRLNEPYLDFLLEAKWPTGRMLRSYTALVDLPVYADERATQVEAVPTQTAPVSSQAAPAPVSQSVTSTTPSSSVSARRPVESERSPVRAVAPQPAPAKRVAVQSAYSGDGYKVQSNQTLSQIARELRPEDGLTVNQTMLAIQKLNPDAFIRNNVNLIKAGAVLRVPTAADVRQMSAAAAAEEVASQTREWRGAQLDATGAARAPVAKKPAADEARLSLTSAGSGLANGKDKAGAGSAGSQQAVGSSTEGVEAAKLKKELDAKRANLKRMIEVKDAELANLQKNLGKDASTKVAPKAAAAPEDKPAEAPKTESPAVPAPVDATASQDQPATIPAEQQVEPPKPAEPVAQEVAPVEPEVVEPGILEIIKSNALYIGIAALALMFGVVAFIFRRKAQADRQAMAENDIANFDFDKAVDYEESAGGVEEAVDVFDEHEVVEELTEAEVGSAEETVMQTSDPIGEADIYIAYGRYDQAADLLSKAIDLSPDNVDLRSKLLEVYLEARNKEGFQQQFIALRGLGQSAAISHAKELLTSVDGVSDWLDDLPSDEKVVAPSYDEDEFASVLSDVDLVEDDIDLGAAEGVSDFSFDELESAVKADPEEEAVSFDLSDDFSFAGETVAETHEEIGDFDAGLSMEFDTSDSDLSSELDSSFVSAPVSESSDAELDLGDLSFDLPEDFASEAEAEEALPELEAVAEEESLALDDFDFGLKETPVATAEEEFSPVEEELSLDGFDLGFTESESEATVPAVEDTLDFSDVDLGLDAGLVSTEPTVLRDAIELAVEEESLPESSITEAEFELGELADLPDMAEPEVVEERVVEQPVAAVIQAQSHEPHVSAPIATLESEDLEFLTDGDEVSTKLDLAQAYVDLGDIDGARDILLEVMKEGRDEQKAEAAALLDSLD